MENQHGAYVLGFQHKLPSLFPGLLLAWLQNNFFLNFRGKKYFQWWENYSMIRERQNLVLSEACSSCQLSPPPEGAVRLRWSGCRQARCSPSCPLIGNSGMSLSPTWGGSHEPSDTEQCVIHWDNTSPGVRELIAVNGKKSWNSFWAWSRQDVRMYHF